MEAISKDPKKSCSYITTVVLSLMKESLIDDITKIKITPQDLGKVIVMLNNDELSSTNAKVILEELFIHG